MEIVVVGRHTEVPTRFRRHVEDKLSKVTQLAPYAQRVDVEVTHEPNPRQAAASERIEPPPSGTADRWSGPRRARPTPTRRSTSR